MAAIAIVTGAGSGIGRAVARTLAGEEGLEVLCVGRRRDPLEETASVAPQRMYALDADVATESGRAAVADAVGTQPVRYLVHNAGVLQPIGPLAEVGLSEWRYSMAVNTEAPLFLTRILLPRLRGGRVLHVSSGAAHRPIPGWGAYCTAKAALHMIYRVLHEELRERDVAVGSLRPGVVDTPMQELIREQSEASFPAVEQFRALKREGELESPERIARFAVAVLTRTDEERFGAAEWDMREHAAELGI